MSHGQKKKRKMGIYGTGDGSQDNRRVTEINSEKWAV